MENTSKPEFSVIIPVYNIEKYVSQCVESVIKQKNVCFEIILVDDGSTDSTGEICDWYAVKTSNLKVIHQENKGSSMARNKGVEYAKGEYIIFLDGDDWWKREDFLEKIANRISEKKTDVIIFNFEKVYENGSKKKYFALKTNMPITNMEFEWIYKNELWIACPWNKVIARKLFEKNKLCFTPNVTSEDIDWCLRLALFAETFDYIAIEGVCYRQREGSISHSISEKNAIQLYNNIEECIKLLKTNKKNPKSILLWSYIAFYVGTLMYNIALLNDKATKQWLMDKCYDKMYILESAVDLKVKIIHKVVKVVGFNCTIKLLQIYGKVR